VICSFASCFLSFDVLFPVSHLCCGSTGSLLKIRVQVLTSGTCERDLIWKESLCGFHQIKIQPYWIGSGLNLMIGISTKRGHLAGPQWPIPVIPATWEAESRRIMFGGHNSSQDSYLQNNQSKMDWRCGSSSRKPTLQAQRPSSNSCPPKKKVVRDVDSETPRTSQEKWPCEDGGGDQNKRRTSLLRKNGQGWPRTTRCREGQGQIFF
jgi:hypothetical protein